MSIWKRAQIKNGPTPFRVPSLSSSSEAYFLVLEEPVVVCWPGAYSDAPGAVDFFAFFILWPGAYSDAPGAVDVVLFCIRWPGALPDEPGDVPWANADAAKSRVPATIRDFLNICSSSVDSRSQRSEAQHVPVLPINVSTRI